MHAVQAIQELSAFLGHITVLSLKVNSEKVYLTPKQATQFIAMRLDLLRMLATPLIQCVMGIIILANQIQPCQLMTATTVLIHLGLLALGTFQKWVISSVANLVTWSLYLASIQTPLKTSFQKSDWQQI